MVVKPDFSRAEGEIRRGAKTVGQRIGEETAGALLTRFSGRVTSGMAAVGRAMQGVAATFVVGDFARRIAAFGLQAAGSLEQAKIGFETLLGSGKAAQTFLVKLQNFAKATPFELPGLIESSRTLLGVGVSADKVIPMLTAFGNTAGAVGVGQEQFQRIMVATAQAISAGRFMTADLNQIMLNGIPIWSILSRAMHKPVPELRQMASQGQLLSKDVLPVLQAQMQKDYGGAMARQSQTLIGVWSTLKDSVSIGLANALKPLIPILRVAIPAAADIASRAFQVGATYVAAFARGIQGSAKEASGSLGTIQHAGQVIRDVFDTLTGRGTRYTDASNPLVQFAATLRVTVMPYLIGVFNEIRTEIIPGLAEMGSGGFGTVTPIVLAFAKTLHGIVIPALATLIEFMNQHEHTARELATVLGVLLGATKVWSLATEVSEGVMKIWGLTLGKNGIIAKSYAAGVAIGTAAEKAHTFAMQLGNSTFVTRLRVMAIDAAQWVRNTAAMIANTAATVAQRVATIAATVATKAWELAQRGLNLVLRANPIGIVITIVFALAAAIIYAYKHSETFRKIVQAMWAGIQAAARAVGGWLTGTLFPSINRAISQAEGFWRGLTNVVSGEWRKITSAIGRARDQVVSIFNALRTWITVTLPNAFHSGVDAMGRWWDSLRAKALTPVHFVVHSIINPFLAGFGRIAGVFGVKTPGPITGLAEGGQIPGPPSSRDNRIAWLRDSSGRVISNIAVATGEFVVNARDTAKALPLLRWINDGMRGGPAEITRRLGRRPVDRAGDGSEGYAFAGGGLVGFLKDVWGAISNPAKLVKAPVEALINKIPGGGQIRDLLVGMGHKLLAGFTNWLSGAGGITGTGSLAKAQAFLRAQNGKPYGFIGASGPNSYDCSGIVSAVWSVLHGKNPYARKFSTETLPGQYFREGVRTGVLVAGWAHPGQRGASANVGHMAGNLAGLPFESTGSRGVHIGPSSTPVTHFAHIGAARANGGLIEMQKIAQVARADFGAVTLAPGANLVYNATGGAEPLTSPANPSTPGAAATGRMHPDDLRDLADLIGDAVGRAMLGIVPMTRAASRQAGRGRNR